MEVIGQLHTLPPPLIHWVGSWVGPTAALDALILHVDFPSPL